MEIKDKDNISAWEKQYRNFKKSFTEILLHPILGENYHSACVSSLACDTESCKDLKYAFSTLKKHMKFWRFLAILNLIVIIALLLKGA